MSKKQWEQPVIKPLNIKETESGISCDWGEGTWQSEDETKTIKTGS